jgi:hypothetical protein
MQKLIVGILSLALVAKCTAFSEVEVEKLEIAPNLWLITSLGDGHRDLIWSDDSDPQGGRIIIPSNIYKIELENDTIYSTVLKTNSDGMPPDTIDYIIDLKNYNENESNSVIISSSNRSK